MELEELFKNKIYTLLRERNIERAKDLLEREIEEDPENFRNYEILGDVYLERGEEEKSLQSYEKAIEMVRKEGEEIELLPLLYKIKKIKGESLDVNTPLCKLFIKYGLKDQFVSTFLNYFKGLVNSKKRKEGIKFIENIFENKALKNEFLFYFLSNFGEGNEYLTKAIEEHEKAGNIEVVEKLKKFLGEEGVDVNELKKIIKIEGIEERKLEPQGTLELAELLDNIGSKEEALNEYLSSIYGFLVEESNLEKCKEILEKIKNLGIEDERIKEVEEFLNNPPTKVKEVKPEEVKNLVKERVSEIVQENVENLKKIARVFSTSLLHEEALKIMNRLSEKNVPIEDILEYYLYSLYEVGEYEKILDAKYQDEEKREIVSFFKALAHEKLGEVNSALEILSEIYEKNPDFMDIEDRLRKLRGEELMEVEKVEEEEVVLEEPEEVVAEEEIIEVQEEAKQRKVAGKGKRKSLEKRIMIIY